MAHSHKHSIQGLPTSISVIDPNNANFHWHTISNSITTTDQFGIGHTHRWRGVLTSAPIDVSQNETVENG